MSSSSKARCNKRTKVCLLAVITCVYNTLANIIFISDSLLFLLCVLAKRWVRFGKDLELLDSPGILPMRISDQAAAIKLAICDDIGERSYDVTDVAGILIQMLARIPEVGQCLGYHFQSYLFFLR